MKKIFLLVPLFTLLACTTGDLKDRSPSSVFIEKDYTLLGVVKHAKIGRRATRVYLKPVSDEPDKFWVMVLEYKKLGQVGVNYLLSNKVPWVSKYITGFLNQINKRATLYKAFPSDTLNTYDLKIVEVKGDELVTREADRYSRYAPRQAQCGCGEASLQDGSSPERYRFDPTLVAFFFKNNPCQRRATSCAKALQKGHSCAHVVLESTRAKSARGDGQQQEQQQRRGRV